MFCLHSVVMSLLVSAVWAQAPAQAVETVATAVPMPGAPATLADAQRAFYSARYEEAAALALQLHDSDTDVLAAYELRTSALLFRVRRALGPNGADNDGVKKCAPCADLVAAFTDEFKSGRELARARVEKAPTDDTALFYLGKLDLNYVWLQLGTLGKRTGWNEYWEARHSLDKVLKRNPDHVRARIARAWIDYIVDTKMTKGFRWILGGGDKKKALAIVRETASTAVDPFARAEARFALWEMEMREKNTPEAVAAATQLASDFPDNQELGKFLTEHARNPGKDVNRN